MIVVSDEYIGFKGTGCDTEFEEVRETEKAYLIRVCEENTEMWLPKSVFQDDGSLNEYGVKLFKEKYFQE